MVSERLRILIVEDHTLFRAGIVALLSQHTDLEVVGEAVNGHEAIHAAGALAPNVVLMDLSMPGINGIEAMVEIKRRNPAIRVLIITAHHIDEYIHASLHAGANGYLLKDATHHELLAAIRSVCRGKTYLSPDISANIVDGYLGTGHATESDSPLKVLTHREREVLKLIAEGHANMSIADYLCLSIKTIEKHRSNLMKKLDLHNAATLTRFAISRGLVDRSVI